MPSARRTFALIACSLGLLGAGRAGAAGPVPAAVDEALIRRLAPEVHLTTYGDKGDGAGNDWTRPSSIDWYLNPHVNDGKDPVGAAMRFNQTTKAGVPAHCASDDSIASPAALNRANVGTKEWKDQYKSGLFCKHSGTTYYATDQNPSKDLTVAYFFLQPRKGTGAGSDYNKVHHGVYGGPNGANPTLFKTDGAGESVADLRKDGIEPDQAPAAGLWVLYAYVLVPSRFGGAADLQYWTFYPYDDSTAGFNHESDWEHVSVTVDANGKVISVYLSEHENGTQFVPDTSGTCSSGFISNYTMALNGRSRRVCIDVSTADSGQHPIVYSADGSHALYPSGCANEGGKCSWDGYAGGTADHTTAAGPAWQGWVVSGAKKNYEIVTDSTDWLQYANLWGEVGIASVTTGKPSPKWQQWGKEVDDHPNGPR
jgi:hypothetical protein